MFLVKKQGGGGEGERKTKEANAFERVGRRRKGGGTKDMNYFSEIRKEKEKNLMKMKMILFLDWR